MLRKMTAGLMLYIDQDMKRCKVCVDNCVLDLIKVNNNLNCINAKYPQKPDMKSSVYT